MTSRSVPIYAIVELLIRMEEYNPEIGNYKDHMIVEKNVRVTTSTGHVTLPLSLVMNQFHSPEAIDETSLKLIAFAYCAV